MVPQMLLIPLFCAAGLLASCPSWAGDKEDRFLELREDNLTETYDLSTVQMLLPGRFAIISTTIINPDVMEFELKAFHTLQTYCARSDGQYPAPADILTLGPPDMPVKKIEVKIDKKSQHKTVHWFYPYKRLVIGGEQRPILPMLCRSSRHSASEATKQNLEIRSLITNGSRWKYVFDCKRGMMSLPLEEADDPAKAKMISAKRGWFRPYVSVCSKVMHETPYLPELP